MINDLTEYERAVFLGLQRKYTDDGGRDSAGNPMNPNYNPSVIVSCNSLRLESANLGTQANVKFAINDTDASVTQSNTEMRLKTTDQFVQTRQRMYIMKVASGGARISTQLRTYPNVKIFTAANESANLNALYGGYFQFEIGSTVKYPNIMALDFLKVPQFQELMTNVTALLAPYTAGGWDRDPFIGNEDTIRMLNPNYKWSGNEKNYINLYLDQAGDALAMAGGAGTNNVVVIYLDGFLIQNVNTDKTNAH